MQLAATMIDAGQIDYALIVNGEGAGTRQENTLDRLQPTATVADVFAQFATLTLGLRRRGDGAGPRRPAPRGPPVRRRRRPGRHRAPRAVRRRPRADAHRHQGPAARPGWLSPRPAWKDAQADFDWADMRPLHRPPGLQVHTEALCQALGHRPDRVPLTFPTRGNIGPARDPVHPGQQPGHAPAPATGCCCWASARGSTPRRRDRLVSLPPRRICRGLGAPGLVPEVTAAGLDGGRAHVARARLARRAARGHAEPVGTLLCVHGNPTWSYLWRRFVARPPAGLAGGRRRPARHGVLRAHRAPRTLAQRIDDLGTADRRARRHRTGPVVHGRPRLGRPGLAGLGAAPPRPAARRRADQHRRPPAGRRQRAAADPARPACPAAAGDHRRGPGRSSAAASACPSPPCRRRCATRSRALRARPAGGGAIERLRRRHPARARRPQRAPAGRDRRRPDGARRRAGAAALGPARPGLLRPLPARPAGGCRTPTCTATRAPPPGHRGRAASPPTSRRWVCSRPAGRPGRCAGAAPDVPTVPDAGRPLWAGLAERAADPATSGPPAVIELGPAGVTAASPSPSWTTGSRTSPPGSTAIGVRPRRPRRPARPARRRPDRRALRLWRAGCVAVVADAGLGLRGMRTALRGAGPAYVIGTAGPGRRQAHGHRCAAISVGPVAAQPGVGSGVRAAPGGHRGAGRRVAPPEPPGRGEAAVVVHLGRHRPGQGRGLPAPAAPGPARAARRPVLDHRRRPARGRLRAVRALRAGAGDPVGGPRHGPHRPAHPDRRARWPTPPPRRRDAGLRLARGAAQRRRDRRRRRPRGRAALARVRLLLSAGAPVPAETLHAMRAAAAAAEAHTPYGMTEVLPVADIDLAGLDDAGAGNGVCVGRPLPGVEVELGAAGR